MASDRLQNTVESLETFLSGVDPYDTVDDVYDHAVLDAEEFLEFDAVIICTVEDGIFEPRAVNADRLIPGAPVPAGNGIAGKTLETDQTYLIGDLEAEPDAVTMTDRFRSVLSIPIGRDGVIQFHSRERNAFSPLDRQLGELLVAVVTNVRDRVIYEEELERQRDRFAALFENVSDAALQYRIEGGTQRIEAVNASFIRTFGDDATEAVDEPIEKLLVPDDEHTGLELPSLPGTDRQDDTEVVCETASGPRPFLLRNVPVTTGDETTRGYLICTDLTELKDRERQLERKNERLDRFARIVSHDLRNPLNVASGYLDLVGERHDDAEFEQIERAHERMDRLIDNVLTLAREGEIDGTEPVSIEAVARQAWANVSTENATLEIDGNRSIEANRERLLQLFENLFRNSVEHGSTSSRSQTDDAHESTGSGVHVRVESLPDGFAVADDGPGIDVDEHDSVFEFGHTTGAGNTGIGLAIVRQISDDHEWSIELTTSAAGGARFEFTECNRVELTSEISSEETR
jgi:signal transduction histidine kinase